MMHTQRLVIGRSKRFLSCWLLCFSLFWSAAPALAARQEIRAAVSLRGGSLVVRVVYEPGQEDWARYVLDQSVLFLPAAERYLGRNFPFRDYILISRCEDCVAHVAGRRVVLSAVETMPGEPSLIFHELGHLWFGYPLNQRCQEWVAEGIVSYLPQAMREAGLLPDEEPYKEGLDRYWGLYWSWPSTEADSSLCNFPKKRPSFRYVKGYKLAHLIYLSLGPLKYRRLLRSLLDHPTLSNQQYIRRLRRLKKRDWAAFLSGWVLRREYRAARPAQFLSDADSDGLMDAEEFASGTNPTTPDSDGDFLPDGSERSLGRDPRKADADGQSLFFTSPPFIDGGGSDWVFRDAARLHDPEGDSRESPSTDLREFRYLIREQALYLQIATSMPLGQIEGTFFDLLVDVDGDNNTDEEFAFYFSAPRSPWRYNSTRGGFTPRGLRSAMGEVIEMRVPLSEIPAGTFRVLPIIRSEAEQRNLDEWDEWLHISPPSLDGR